MHQIIVPITMIDYSDIEPMQPTILFNKVFFVKAWVTNGLTITIDVMTADQWAAYMKKHHYYWDGKKHRKLVEPEGGKII